MVDRAVIDAQEAFERESHKIMKDLHRKAKSRIAAALREIGKNEVKNTNNRLKYAGGLAKIVGDSKVIDAVYKSSPNKNQLGTLTFGTDEIVQGKGRWKTSTMTGEVINLVEMINTGVPSGTITSASLHTDAQKQRGFIFGGNHPTTPKRLKTKLKVGTRTPALAPVDDFLPQAERNIVSKLENAVTKAIDKTMREIGRKQK